MGERRMEIDLYGGRQVHAYELPGMTRAQTRLKATSRVKLEGDNCIVVVRKQDIREQGITGWEVAGHGRIKAEQVISLTYNTSRPDCVFYMKTNPDGEPDFEPYTRDLITEIKD